MASTRVSYVHVLQTWLQMVLTGGSACIYSTLTVVCMAWDCVMFSTSKELAQISNSTNSSPGANVSIP